MQSRTKRDFDTKFSRMRIYNNDNKDQEGNQGKAVKSELKSKQEILKVFIAIRQSIIDQTEETGQPIDEYGQRKEKIDY